MKSAFRVWLKKAGDILNVLAENGNTVLPFIVLFVGGAIITQLPEPVTHTLFATNAERDALFEKFGITPEPKKVLLIMTATCEACIELQGKLDEAGVPYSVLPVPESPIVPILLNKAKMKGATGQLPLAILDTEWVDPTAEAIRSVSR